MKMSDYGDLEFDEEWEEKPLQKYMEYKRTRDKITKSRYGDIRRTLVQSPEDSEYQAWDEFLDWESKQTIDDAWAFLDQLRESLAESSCEECMEIVLTFLDHLMQREVVSSNPARYVYDEATFDREEKDWIERTPEEVGEFIGSIQDPLFRAATMLFAKLGIRQGENYNIDLPFLHLDHPGYYELLEQHGVTLHDEVEDYPDSLYIPSEPTKDEDYRGEKRLLGNKRVRGTRLPIDEETKHALLTYLAIRPKTEYPHPLWTGKKSYQGRERIGKNAFKRRIAGDLAEEHGFYQSDSEKDYSTHWFRHFFNTNMKPGFGNHTGHIDPIMVKFLRGDRNTSNRSDSDGKDIMEVYTHDWGNQIQRKYLENIYQFGI